jgi:hypothetical protein
MVKIMKIKINTKITISGPGLICTGTIKNTYPFTFGSYIKEGSVYSYNKLYTKKIVVRIATNLILTTNDITESIQ